MLFHIFNIFLIYVKNTILKNINAFHKIGWKSDFQKNLPSLETNLTLLFFLFHWHDPKQKQNHQISACREKIRSTRSQTCVKYRGNIICIKRNTDVNTSDLKNVQKRLIFQAFSSISPKFYVVCHQPYAWLESYDRYGSFGTMIWGSLIVSPVLWLLSPRNTLSVTHSDTASYLSLLSLICNFGQLCSCSWGLVISGIVDGHLQWD